MYLSLIAASSFGGTFFLQQQSPFEPPRAKLTYAPNRNIDLLNVDVILDIDYPNRRFTGIATSSVAPLESGKTSIHLHAGAKLQVHSVKVDGKATTFVKTGEDLQIKCPPTVRGKKMSVTISYSSERQRAGGFGSEGGWHWIEPEPSVDGREGAWTQGETNYNRNWAPTWDYPNDFATSSTTVTVQKDWSVIGNGKLVSDVVKGNRRTVKWVMTQPHATYLLSLCVGPFDIKKDKWQDVDLWYVTPKHKGWMIDGSFGDTKDMLTFYSTKFGVKYPWPKYAQNAMYDFGGGMENVSATTLGEGSLTDPRSGFYDMSSLNAHELGHQWFGDLVSCKDWGNTWLNESFATFAEALYFEHARGKWEYQREIEGQMRSYFAEAARYTRPLNTRWYPNDDAMFDSHSYPKGGAVLFTLRKFLGDEKFFAGIKRYLTVNRHSPVETADLAKAMTDASGVNLEPFFEQWVNKPGHPVLEYSWEQKSDGSGIKVTIKQVQNRSKGAPIYEIPTQIGVFTGIGMTRQPILLNAEEQTIEIAGKRGVTAVILDPDHAFLRQMRHSFNDSELASIFEFAPSAIDRQTALTQLIGTKPDAATAARILEIVGKDLGQFPVFTETRRLAELNHPQLKSFWLREMNHKMENRRRTAVDTLLAGTLTPTERQTILKMVNGTEMYSIVTSIISRLNGKADLAVLMQALKIPSRENIVRDAALRTLVRDNPEVAWPHVAAAVRGVLASSAEFEGAGSLTALDNLEHSAAKTALLKEVLRSSQQRAVTSLLADIEQSKDKSFVPLLEAAAANMKFSEQTRTRIKGVADRMKAQ